MSSSTVPSRAPQSPRVRLRRETYRKWRRICDERRWTFTEAADALADEYLSHHGIADLPSAPAEGNGSSSRPSIPGRTDNPRAERSASQDAPDAGALSNPPGALASAADTRPDAVPKPSVEDSPPLD